MALGKQALSIKFPGDSATRRFTMTITGAQLEVTPSTVVPNQSVTITGRGFTGNARLFGITDRSRTTEDGTKHYNDPDAETTDGSKEGLWRSKQNFDRRNSDRLGQDR